MAKSPKLYPVTWEGQLIVACRKCQKKLQGGCSFTQARQA
jgi:hypothetical protein